MKELRALTGIRGIAAWFVVLYHIRLSIAGLPAGVRDLFAKGYLAVDFFFLLSGFVIWLTWHARLHEQGAAGVPRFLLKRVARIWPLHLVTLGGTVALATVLAMTGRAEPLAYPFAQLPLHVLLLQNWGFTDRLTWNDPSWSISTELAAYLAFAVLIPRCDWRRVATIAILVAIVALAGLLWAVMRWGNANLLGDDIAHFGLIRCLVEFACGTGVAAIWLRWRDWNRAVPIAIAALVVSGSAWAIGIDETFAGVPTFAALLMLIALTAGRAHNPLETRVIHYLGEISYATYLSHFLLWKAFKLAFVSNASAVPPVLIALYLAIVLVSSIALYHLVERPAQRWINGLSTPPNPTVLPR